MEKQKNEDIEKFQEKLAELQKEHGLQLYAANALIGGEHGEVIPVIKIRRQEPEMVNVEEKK